MVLEFGVRLVGDHDLDERGPMLRRGESLPQRALDALRLAHAYAFRAAGSRDIGEVGLWKVVP